MHLDPLLEQRCGTGIAAPGRKPRGEAGGTERRRPLSPASVAAQCVAWLVGTISCEMQLADNLSGIINDCHVPCEIIGNPVVSLAEHGPSVLMAWACAAAALSRTVPSSSGCWRPSS